MFHARSLMNSTASHLRTNNPRQSAASGLEKGTARRGSPTPPLGEGLRPPPLGAGLRPRRSARVSDPAARRGSPTPPLGAGLRPRRNRRPKVSRDLGDLRSETGHSAARSETGHSAVARSETGHSAATALSAASGFEANRNVRSGTSTARGIRGAAGGWLLRRRSPVPFRRPSGDCGPVSSTTCPAGSWSSSGVRARCRTPDVRRF
jgi:hypothetical protein